MTIDTVKNADAIKATVSKCIAAGQSRARCETAALAEANDGDGSTIVAYVRAEYDTAGVEFIIGQKDDTWPSFRAEVSRRLRTPGGLRQRELQELIADGRCGHLLTATLKAAAAWERAVFDHPLAHVRYVQCMEDALVILGERPRSPIRREQFDRGEVFGPGPVYLFARPAAT